jgi:anti-sigma factor RsiW
LNTGEIEEMVCIEVVEVVTAYLERAMSDTERVRLEAHLEVCRGCDAYVAQMRTTIAGLRDLGEAVAPADLDSLLAAFRARRDG